MTQNRNPKYKSQIPPDYVRQQLSFEVTAEAAPPFNLPPLPKSRRTEIRVPASINGRDLSQGHP